MANCICDLCVLLEFQSKQFGDCFARYIVGRRSETARDENEIEGHAILRELVDGCSIGNRNVVAQCAILAEKFHAQQNAGEYLEHRRATTPCQC